MVVPAHTAPIVSRRGARSKSGSFGRRRRSSSRRWSIPTRAMLSFLSKKLMSQSLSELRPIMKTPTAAGESKANLGDGVASDAEEAGISVLPDSAAADLRHGTRTAMGSSQQQPIKFGREADATGVLACSPASAGSARCQISFLPPVRHLSEEIAMPCDDSERGHSSEDELCDIARSVVARGHCSEGHADLTACLAVHFRCQLATAHAGGCECRDDDDASDEEVRQLLCDRAATSTTHDEEEDDYHCSANAGEGAAAHNSAVVAAAKAATAAAASAAEAAAVVAAAQPLSVGLDVLLLPVSRDSGCRRLDAAADKQWQQLAQQPIFCRSAPTSSPSSPSKETTARRSADSEAWLGSRAECLGRPRLNFEKMHQKATGHKRHYPRASDAQGINNSAPKAKVTCLVPLLNFRSIGSVQSAYCPAVRVERPSACSF